MNPDLSEIRVEGIPVRLDGPLDGPSTDYAANDAGYRQLAVAMFLHALEDLERAQKHPTSQLHQIAAADARQFLVHPTVFHQILDLDGGMIRQAMERIEATGSLAPEISPERVRRAAETYDSNGEAAEALGVHPGSFGRLCTQHGIASPRMRRGTRDRDRAACRRREAVSA